MSKKTLEQKIKVMQAASEGKRIYITPNDPSTLPSVVVDGDIPRLEFNWAYFDYEVYEEPKTKPSINWDHVSPKYNWMATDGDGETYLYEGKPTSDDYTWFFNGCCASAEAFSSYVPGTCDWKDSLVQRPE